MTTFVKGYFRREPYPYHTRETIQAAADELRRKLAQSEAYIKTTESLLPYDLGDELIGALLRANLAEPLDGEEFDDLSDERKQTLRETM